LFVLLATILAKCKLLFYFL